MGRRRQWPPRLTRHSSGNARVHWRGADHYLGPWGDDPDDACEAAKKAYAELLARLDSQPQQTRPANGLLVCEAVELWQADEGQRYTGVEADHYARALAALVEAAGTMRMADVGIAELSAARKVMIAQRLSAAVINRRVVRIRTVWRWLEQQGYAPRGSWSHLRTLPSIAKHDRRVRHCPDRQPAMWADVARICRHAPPPIRAMLLLGWFTGARPGELCQLRPADIDRTDKDCWVFRPGSHKNAWRGHQRAIALGHVCQKILAPFLDGCAPRGYLFVPSDRCRQRKQACFNTDTYGHAVRRAARRAGVTGFLVYSLRHSFRLRVTRAGMSLDLARAALGQSSVETTNDYAAGADLELAKRVAKKLG